MGGGSDMREAASRHSMVSSLQSECTATTETLKQNSVASVAGHRSSARDHSATSESGGTAPQISGVQNPRSNICHSVCSGGIRDEDGPAQQTTGRLASRNQLQNSSRSNEKTKRAVKPMALHTWWTLISATRPRTDTVVALQVQSPEGIGAAEWTRRVPDVWVGEDGGDKGQVIREAQSRGSQGRGV